MGHGTLQMFPAGKACVMDNPMSYSFLLCIVCGILEYSKRLTEDKHMWCLSLSQTSLCRKLCVMHYTNAKVCLKFIVWDAEHNWHGLSHIIVCDSSPDHTPALLLRVCDTDDLSGSCGMDPPIAHLSKVCHPKGVLNHLHRTHMHWWMKNIIVNLTLLTNRLNIWRRDHISSR